LYNHHKCKFLKKINLNPTWEISFKSQPNIRYIFEIHRGVGGGYLGERLHGEIWKRGWSKNRIAGRHHKRREREGLGKKEDKRKKKGPTPNQYRQE
jgi:hypothetical protein